MAARSQAALGLGLVVGLLTSACRPAPPPPVVAVVVTGEHAPAIEKVVATADVGVALRIEHSPKPSSPMIVSMTASGPVQPPGAPTATASAAETVPGSQVELALSSARADYASGELGRVRTCAETLGDPALLWSSLARRARVVAARVLVLRIACTTIVRRDDAIAAASTFASLGLEVPSEVDAIPVEAHKILTAALRAAESAPRQSLVIESAPRDATVILDGRGACATPCETPLSPGDHHVMLEKNGWSPVARVVRLSGAKTRLAIPLEPASPTLAAQQWASTYGTNRPHADDGEAIALLALSLRARRLVYLDAEGLGGGERIRGALAIESRVVARDEQRGPAPDATHDVLRELLVKGGVVESSSVFRKPLFWIAVGVGAAASAALTAYLLYDPGTRTEVRAR